jgi:hypothetical protein
MRRRAGVAAINTPASGKSLARFRLLTRAADDVIWFLSQNARNRYEPEGVSLATLATLREIIL